MKVIYKKALAIVVFLSFVNEPHASGLDGFYKELYKEPVILKIVSNENVAIGIVEIIDEQDFKLIDLIQGSIEKGVQDALFEGINLKSCSNNYCDLINDVFYNRNELTLYLRYKEREVGFHSPYSEDFSFFLKNDLNFSGDYANLVSNGMFSVNKNASLKVETNLNNSTKSRFEISNVSYEKMNGIYSSEFGILKGSNFSSKSNSSTGSVYGQIFGFAFSKESEVPYYIESSSNKKRNLSINLSKDSIVSVIYDGRVIDVQRLSSGIRQIDVSSYPKGNYQVTLEIESLDGQDKYQVNEYVFNSNYIQYDEGLDYGLLVGLKDFNDDFKSPLFATYLNTAYKYVDIGFFANISDDESSIKSTFETSYENINFYIDSMYDGFFSSRQQINYNYNPLSINIGNFYSDAHEASSNEFNVYYAISSSSNMRINYNDGASKSYGGSIYKRFNFGDFKPRVELGYSRSSFEDSNDDRLYINFNISFNNDKHNVDYRTGLLTRDGVTERDNSLSYSLYRNDSFFDSVSIGLSETASRKSINTNLGMNHEILRGNLYFNKELSDGYESFAGSLSSTLYGNDNLITASSENSTQGFIVNVEGLDKNKSASLSINYMNFEVYNGINFIPSFNFGENNVNVMVPNGHSLVGDSNISVNLSKLSFETIKLDFVKSTTVIGRIVSDIENTKSILVTNHISNTYTDDYGVFVLDVSNSEPIISLNGFDYDLSDKLTDDSGIVYIEDIEI